MSDGFTTNYAQENFDNAQMDADEARWERQALDERKYHSLMMADEFGIALVTDAPKDHGWVTLELGVTEEQIEAWDAM